MYGFVQSALKKHRVCIMSVWLLKMIKRQVFRTLTVVEKCKQVNFSILFIHLVKNWIVLVNDGSSDVFMLGGAGKNTRVLLNCLNYCLRFAVKLNDFLLIPVLFQIVQHPKKSDPGFSRPNYVHLKNCIFVWPLALPVRV